VILFSLSLSLGPLGAFLSAGASQARKSGSASIDNWAEKFRFRDLERREVSRCFARILAVVYIYDVYETGKLIAARKMPEARKGLNMAKD